MTDQTSTAAAALAHMRRVLPEAKQAIAEAGDLEAIVTECERRLGLIPTGDQWA